MTRSPMAITGLAAPGRIAASSSPVASAAVPAAAPASAAARRDGIGAVGWEVIVI